MSTFSELTDSTMLYLHGFTTVQDQSTYLTQSATDSDLTLKIADTSAMSRGLVEIGDELLMVDTVDDVSLNMVIPPYGRGFRGTTASAHASGERVVSAPMFPRFLVKRAINEAIRSVYPELFAVAETTFTYNAAKNTYEMPAGTLDILSVSWQTTGPSKEWLPLRRWRLDRHANTTAFTSGASLSVYDGITPGRTIKVVYTSEPTGLTNDDDDFVTTTGLPISCEDLIRLGAAYRMVPFFDAAHLSGMSSEADFSANARPVGGSSQLGRYMLQLYQVRLQEEVNGLQRIYPTRSHYTR
jgi:hypothetical protein